MATLMTPERSHSTPARAPRISGTAVRIVFCSRPSKSNDVPEEPVTDQHRKLTTKQNIVTASTQRIARRRHPKTTCHSPRITMALPRTTQLARAGRVTDSFGDDGD